MNIATLMLRSWYLLLRTFEILGVMTEIYTRYSGDDINILFLDTHYIHTVCETKIYADWRKSPTLTPEYTFQGGLPSPDTHVNTGCCVS